MEVLRNPFRAAPRAAPASAALDDRLRPMTGFEEEFIEANLSGEPTALVHELLARCLVAPGADPSAALAEVRALTVPERDRALVRLRQRSLGDTVETLATCPRCGHRTAVSFPLSALPLDFPAPPRELTVALPDGRRAVLRCSTAGDQELLLARPAGSAAAQRSALLALALLRLGDEAGPFSPEQVHAFPTGVRAALADALAAALPDLRLRMGVACEGCGAEYAAPFDVAAFFLPS